MRHQQISMIFEKRGHQSPSLLGDRKQLIRESAAWGYKSRAQARLEVHYRIKIFFAKLDASALSELRLGCKWIKFWDFAFQNAGNAPRPFNGNQFPKKSESKLQTGPTFPVQRKSSGHNINMNWHLPKLPECLNHNLNAHAKPFNPLQPKNSSNAAKSDDKNSEDPISTSLSKQSEIVLQNEMHKQHDETP